MKILRALAMSLTHRQAAKSSNLQLQDLLGLKPENIKHPSIKFSE